MSRMLPFTTTDLLITAGALGAAVLLAVALLLLARRQRPAVGGAPVGLAVVEADAEAAEAGPVVQAA